MEYDTVQPFTGQIKYPRRIFFSLIKWSVRNSKYVASNTTHINTGWQPREKLKAIFPGAGARGLIRIIRKF